VRRRRTHDVRILYAVSGFLGGSGWANVPSFSATSSAESPEGAAGRGIKSARRGVCSHSAIVGGNRTELYGRQFSAQRGTASVTGKDPGREHCGAAPGHRVVVMRVRTAGQGAGEVHVGLEAPAILSRSRLYRREQARSRFDQSWQGTGRTGNATIL
jgi:hypothetical protein